jgi:hypothetical protein
MKLDICLCWLLLKLPPALRDSRAGRAVSFRMARRRLVRAERAGRWGFVAAYERLLDKHPDR